MLRVGDHHIGIFHLGHHPVVGHFPLPLFDFLLDLGTTLGVLHFVTHLLACHFEFLVHLVLLNGHIGQSDQQQTHAQPKAGIDDQLTGDGHGLVQVQVGQVEQLFHVVVDLQQQNTADHHKLGN